MGLLGNTVINLYSIALLAIICFHLQRQNEKGFLQYKIYAMMVRTTMLLLLLDIAGRFDGRPDTLYPMLNQAGNFLLFCMNLVMPSWWLLYVYNQICRDEKKTMRLFYQLAALNCVNAAAVIVSLAHGWLYSIDSENIYHRGPFFFIPIAVTFVMMAVTYVLIVKNRDKIVEEYYYALSCYAIPPCIGIVLQIFIGGVSFSLNSSVISLLIVFFRIQSHIIHTDYLTGLNNRKQLDMYLEKKISTSTSHQTFAAIMLDMNHFKTINDKFGHDEGDNALKVTSKLLRSCLRMEDFIARFGGDEFCIVLDISREEELRAIVDRINQCFETYNKTGKHPYELSMSIGYDIYDHQSGMKSGEFQKQLDILMYEDKQSYRARLMPECLMS